MKKTTLAKVMMWIGFVVFLLYAITLLFPFAFMILNSFKTHSEFYANPWSLPKEWLFSNYIKALNVNISGGYSIFTVLVNSVLYTVISTAIVVMMPFLASYACSKYKFKLRPLCTALVMVQIAVPLVGSQAATYKLLQQLNLYNNWYWSLFLMSSGGFGGSYLLYKASLDNTSWTYAEAAFIDGASDFKVMTNIMLPMVKPIVMIQVIMGFIGAWNEYTSIWLYAPKYPTVGLALKTVTDNVNSYGYPVMFALMLIMLAPVMALFLSFQNTIMNHMILGGLKG